MKKQNLRTTIRIFSRHARSISTGTLGFVLAIAAFLFLTRPLRSDNFVFYLPASHDVIPLQPIGKTNYLPLLRVLNLVGRVDALRESTKKLRVWFGNTLMEVSDGNRKVTINKTSLSLPEPVRLVDGQWLVPVDFLGVVLPRLISEGVEYRAGSNRIFIGGTKPSTFTVHLSDVPGGARLQIEFTSPLTFQTAARNGKWILFLGNLPVEPLEQDFEFNNPYIHSLKFDDQDGVPKLILSPSAAGLDLYPVLEVGGKVLRADVLKPASPEQAAQASPAQGPGQGAQPTAPTSAPGETPSEISAAPGTVIVLDAGHGGSNLGAQGQNDVMEKNLTAQIVVRVRAALLATGRYRVILTRVGDTDPDFDQRALVANTVRTTAFLSFHAGNLGLRTPRVAVYTYEPPDPAAFQPAAPRPLLVPWAQIQAYHLDDSRRLAQALRDQIGGTPDLLTSSPDVAPVRMLRSVDAPAVAVEVGSLTPTQDSGALQATVFQQKLSNAVLAALDSFTRKAH